MEYRLDVGLWNQVFAVPAALVDRHLKLAGKEQLQVILWLLRHPDRGFAPAELAQALGMPEEAALDCLDYYPDMENSAYCIVLADGDVNEDGVDSRISCTRMKLVKELSLSEFVMHSLNYIFRHPYRSDNRRVEKDRGEAGRGFVIVRGKEPAAKGELGAILAFAKEEPERRDIFELGMYEVDGREILPGTWYDINGRAAE